MNIDLKLFNIHSTGGSTPTVSDSKCDTKNGSDFKSTQRSASAWNGNKNAANETGHR